MFNFFKKDNTEKRQDDAEVQEEVKEDEPLASVTYYIKQGSSDVFLDIFISDYEDETLKKMAKILSSLSSLRLSVETMNMVKESLVESGEEEIFVNLVKYTMQYTQNDTDSLKQLSEKIKEVTKEKGEEKEKEDQPWIKPSEIIR